MNSKPPVLNKQELEQGSVFQPSFGADSLITAVVQDTNTGDILMLAHMNTLAIEKTLETGKAHFWSRSRKKLWMKGETSGNTLDIVQILTDCDQDALVLQVKLNGQGACHTGVYSCFYRKVDTTDGAQLLPLNTDE